MGAGSPDNKAEREDVLFGRIAVSKHFAAPHHVRECMDELNARTGGRKTTLADIMLKRGYVTISQVKTIRGMVAKETGPDRIGKYELIEKIGEGGMGSVFKAKDADSSRVVALKVLPSKLAEDRVFMGRFQREAIAVTRLDHPHIVRGLDIGESDGAHFIAMEFIDGPDCDKMLMRRGRLPEKEAAKIAAQIAEALQYAHGKKLVHRDIKPANILITQDGTAKLTDLGLAKSTSVTAAKLTQTGITMGTPHYISPEQAMGASDLDIRSDLYSLGATLYQLLTGRVPFEGSSPAIIVAKHLTEELENPKDIVPELSDGIISVLEKALAKERDDRYEQPADFAKDLERVILGKAPLCGELDVGKSTIMKSAEIREAAERVAAKRKQSESRRSSISIVVAMGIGMAITAAVVVVLLYLNGTLSTDAFKPLTNGKSFEGWETSGNWNIDEAMSTYSCTNKGTFSTKQKFTDADICFEFSSPDAATAYLAFGSATKKLKTDGGSGWKEARVIRRGGNVKVVAPDASTDNIKSGNAASTPAPLTFGVKKGTLRIRFVKSKPVEASK